MKTKTNFLIKRVMPIAMALLMVLSVVLVPMSVNAAEKPYGPAQIVLKKGKSYTLVLGFFFLLIWQSFSLSLYSIWIFFFCMM